MPKIYLDSVTFTDQDDIVPLSGKALLDNTARFRVVNTFAGNDILNADNEIEEGSDLPGAHPNKAAFINESTLNTAEGNDSITGIVSQKTGNSEHFGIWNRRLFDFYTATIETGDGNDVITGIIQPDIFGNGIENSGGSIDTEDGNDKIIGTTQTNIGINHEKGSINTGNGQDTITGTAGYLGIQIGIFMGPQLWSVLDTGKDNDIITGIGGEGIEPDSPTLYGSSRIGISNYATFNTDDGDDIITGIGRVSPRGSYGIINENNGAINTGNDNDIITGIGGYIGIQNSGFFDKGTINTGNGNDIINAIGGIYGLLNTGTIDVSDGNDSIISHGNFRNSGWVFLGDGKDSITADADLPNRALENFGFIGTGDGSDTITSTGVLYNQGVIETGNGDDSIIVDGGVDDNLTGTRYGIYNNGGAINMGDGNDSIIANEGFESAPNSGGAWFLGEGDDYIKGYGSGDFYGGNGFDRLELTPGTYTLKKWADNTGESIVFTKGSSLMITSEFEQLIAGGTIYDFTSLTEGQIITVA